MSTLVIDMGKASRDFASLLPPGVAGPYLKNRYSLSWVYVESSGSSERFCRQIDEDIQRYESLHQAISLALSENPTLRSGLASRWVAFLKPRIERLESWSSALAYLAAITAASATLNATAMSYLSTGMSLFLTCIGFLATGVILSFRFGVDRQRLWYRYLVAHLEALKATNAAG